MMSTPMKAPMNNLTRLFLILRADGKKIQGKDYKKLYFPEVNISANFTQLRNLDYLSDDGEILPDGLAWNYERDGDIPGADTTRQTQRRKDVLHDKIDAFPNTARTKRLCKEIEETIRLFDEAYPEGEDE